MEKKICYFCLGGEHWERFGKHKRTNMGHYSWFSFCFVMDLTTVTIIIKLNNKTQLNIYI